MLANRALRLRRRRVGDRWVIAPATRPRRLSASLSSKRWSRIFFPRYSQLPSGRAIGDGAVITTRLLHNADIPGSVERLVSFLLTEARVQVHGAARDSAPCMTVATRSGLEIAFSRPKLFRDVRSRCGRSLLNSSWRQLQCCPVRNVQRQFKEQAWPWVSVKTEFRNFEIRRRLSADWFSFRTFVFVRNRRKWLKNCGGLEI